MDFDKESDQRVREEAFNWLGEQVSLYGETLPREILAQGFQLDGQTGSAPEPAGDIQAFSNASPAFNNHFH